jgi:hypothetical protein
MTVNFIIQPNQDKYDFNNYLENYLNNNNICHYLLVKYNTENIQIIKNHFRKIKNNFTKLVRGNKINLKNAIIQIKNIENIISKVETNFNVKINYNDELCNELLQHQIMKIIFIKSIHENDNIKEEYEYLENKIENMYFTELDNSIYEHIPNNNDFDSLFEYYIINKNKYYFVNNKIFMANIINLLINKINDTNDKFEFIKNNIEKIKLLIKLVGEQVIDEVILSFIPNTVDIMLDYILLLDNFISLDIIHIYIKNKNIFDDKLVTNKIIQNITNKKHNNIYIYSLVKEIDIFMGYIIVDLMKRIYNYNYNIEFEKEEYCIMKKEIKNEHLYKYNKILNSEIKNYNNINILNVSPHVWNLDFDFGYYENNTDNKINKLYLHLGSCELQINNCKIKCLPIHSYILNMIYNKSYLMGGKSFPHYKSKYIEIIEKSLYNNNIIKLSGENYNINYDFCNDIDIINYDNINMDITTIEQNVKNEILFERIDIIIVNIINVIKHNEYNKNQLFQIISNKIKVFVFNNEEFKQAIDIMLKKDYIKIDNNDIISNSI